MNRQQCILIVDDVPESIEILGEVLGDSYDIRYSFSGEEAISSAEEMAPDLILLDVMLPDMDGMEVCARLKENDATRDVPVIFITAKSGPEAETMAFAAGAVDFVSKPVNPATLRARVKVQLALKAGYERMKTEARIDGLTGVANRRYFDQSIDLEWRNCRRLQLPLAVLMIDLDHFKHYNDCYGHQAGDECLRAVAKAIAATVGRPHDLVARYGGEEFVCLLPGANLPGGLLKARQMRDAVFALDIAHAGSPVASVVTLSIGVAATVPDEHSSPAELLAQADEHLYTAKRSGRNQAYAGEPSVEPSAFPGEWLEALFIKAE